jgi:hypothetical protein
VLVEETIVQRQTYRGVDGMVSYPFIGPTVWSSRAATITCPTINRCSIGSFASDECTVGPTSSCDQFDRLLGSRMLVGNLEFRFPLLRPFGARAGMYGPVPVEAAFFIDGGVAWSRGARQPSLAEIVKACRAGA